MQRGPRYERLRRNSDLDGSDWHRCCERGGRLRRATPSDKEVREMVRRYESGESLDRVGSCLGFSAGTVRNHLLRAGTVLRDTHGR